MLCTQVHANVVHACFPTSRVDVCMPVSTSQLHDRVVKLLTMPAWEAIDDLPSGAQQQPPQLSEPPRSQHSAWPDASA